MVLVAKLTAAMAPKTDVLGLRSRVLMRPVSFVLQKAEHKVEQDRETLGRALPDFVAQVESKL
jgi:hypothetical protein